MPERARRRRVAHDRLVLIGLAPHEVSLARTAAAGAYEIVVAHDQWPLTGPDGSRPDAVYVTSLAWWERARTRTPTDRTLHAQRCVLLVPAEPAPASRWRVADALPLAIPVFTHAREPELLLARAILAVRHGTVADALRAQLARASAAPDLPTRALDAALALLPDERTVPRLARALHRSERTLRRHLAEARADLTPQEVLRWALLLHAAWDLTATGDPFARAARRVAASDAANLRRMLRISTGLTPRVLLANGRDPVDRMLARWHERMAAPPPSRPAG